MFGVLGPLASAPQVLAVYTEKDASGLVAASWGAWAVMNITWILYGLAHRDLPIAVTYTLWFFINMSMCVGALLYGGTVY